MSQYNPKVARTPAQLEKMKDLMKRGVCIFCPKYIHEDLEKVEIETDYWMVKKNAYPYEGTRLHILLIPKAHVSIFSKLPKPAQAEFVGLVVRCEKHYKLVSYAMGIRAGDMRFNGGSIEHLHAHIVVGDTDNPKHEPVRFKMSHRSD
ncbi:MAG: HIT family protein [bacterium]|nr:HIT family protein [bacterium]